MLLVCGGDPQLLARVDQIGVLDLITIRLVDSRPLVRVPVETLGDLGKAVPGDDCIGLLRPGRA